MNRTIQYKVPLIVKGYSWDVGQEDPDLLDPTARVAEETAQDFNSDDLARYSDLKYLVRLHADARGSQLVVTAEVEGDVSPERILEVKRFLSGQCSDGWGEGFEQQTFTGRSSGYPHYREVYISTWSTTQEPELLDGG